MKKLVLILIFLLGTAGCYDYVELNDLAIVSGIGIDQEDDGYRITFEILNQAKTPDPPSIEAQTISGTGATIATAFNNTANQTPRRAYLAHLKVLVLDQKLQPKQIIEILDYIFRAPQIRNEFHLLVTQNCKAAQILNLKNKNIPIISTQIETLIESNKYQKSNANQIRFVTMVIDYFNKQKDPAFNVIRIHNNELEIKGLALYHGFNFKTYISPNEATIYNLLVNNKNHLLFPIIMKKNKPVVLTIHTAHTSLKIVNHRVVIDVAMEGAITEYTIQDSLKSEKTFKKLNTKFNQQIQTKIDEFYHLIQNEKTDVLGITDQYYSKYGTKPDWTKLEVRIQTKLKINRKGLIFKVRYDN